MMTMIMSDNTNTYTNTGDHEQQMAGLEIHHVSSPWHNRHITTSLLSTVCSPCLTVYTLHPLLHPHLILMVRSLTFFSLFLFLLIILSIRSTATTPVHHHYQYLQSTPNHIFSRRVCVSSLRSFFLCVIGIRPHLVDMNRGRGMGIRCDYCDDI